MRDWSLQDAKARFSELVRTCVAEGPQTVTLHGKPAVVVVPFDEFCRVNDTGGSLKEFLLSAPRVDLDVPRSQDSAREIDL